MLVAATGMLEGTSDRWAVLLVRLRPLTPNSTAEEKASPLPATLVLEWLVVVWVPASTAQTAMTAEVWKAPPPAGPHDGMAWNLPEGVPLPPPSSGKPPGQGQFGGGMGFQHGAPPGDNLAGAVAGLGGQVPPGGGGGGGSFPPQAGMPGQGVPRMGDWLDASTFMAASAAGHFAIGNFVEIVTLNEHLSLDGTALFRITGMYQPSALGILLDVSFRGASAIPRSVEFGIAFGANCGAACRHRLCTSTRLQRRKCAGGGQRCRGS